jgi:hypothetical protein
VNGVDEEVAVGGGCDLFAPVVVGQLRVMVIEADRLEGAVAGVKLEGRLTNFEAKRKRASGRSEP